MPMVRPLLEKESAESGFNASRTVILTSKTSMAFGIFYVKDAPRTGKPVVENVVKITEIIEVDRHVSSRSITQELKMDLKTVLNHLHKVGFKKKLHVWVPHQSTKKHDGSNFHLRSLGQTERNQPISLIDGDWG
ncbi:histone-lysine N-methyltransferase SETMAR [Trichonephila clavipes]|nr:histone-lysine N-methyltransferase SETMAR [Trichonephila clavipes]